jgi:iron(III) transport system substrate-binding protein
MIEFLASDEAQSLFAAENFEYPVNPAIKPSALVAAWGTFTPDTLNMAEIGKYQELARRLVAETGFND